MQRAAVWEETNGENGEGERGWLGPCSSYAAEREKNTEKRYFRRTKKKRKEMPETAEREVGRRPQKIIMRVTPDSSYSSVEEEEEKREGRGGGAATTAATEEDVEKKGQRGETAPSSLNFFKYPPSTAQRCAGERTLQEVNLESEFLHPGTISRPDSLFISPSKSLPTTWTRSSRKPPAAIDSRT